jgi:GNAT superfamily N-acetyltransferase
MHNKANYKYLSIADFEQIISLWESSGLSHRPLGRDSHDNIARQMQEENTHFVGRYIDNELAAVAIVSHNGRKGWINRLAVAQKFQHQQVATQMIAYCENWLQDQGIEIFGVLIDADNAVSMQLFERNKYISHQDIIYYTKRVRDEI